MKVRTAEGAERLAASFEALSEQAARTELLWAEETDEIESEFLRHGKERAKAIAKLVRLLPVSGEAL